MYKKKHSPPKKHKKTPENDSKRQNLKKLISK